MIQNCSYIRVLEVFFKEPTKVHFIREISRKIDLAQTSVRNHIKTMEKENLIEKKESKPFNGFVANRENEKFISYKQVYNLYSLITLKKEIAEKIGPKAIILFGSYQKGEDIEESDVDLVVISKIKKEIPLGKYEKRLSRNIHITFVKDVNRADKNIRDNLKRGWILYGRI
ncbi:MAG: nucleotidyltransferase domain-containing protein [Candidatus Pacearchaeota archaeon]